MLKNTPDIDQDYKNSVEAPNREAGGYTYSITESK